MASSYIRPDHGLADGKWPLWLVATAFIILIGLRVTDVFAGVIPGADDMMRLQQIRDLLGGQGWFDVAQSRMLTPEGGDMHWSRLPDLFVAGVILLTEPVLGRETAEQLAIGIWPLILLTGAFTFLHVVMERLQVNRAGQVFGFICFATSAAVFNFWPGRIDHHGLVVVLTLAGFAAVLSPGLSARSAVLLALCVTAILSIALEGLPYIAGLIAICEDLPEAHNRVTLDPDLTDAHGIPAPRIDYRIGENTAAMLEHSVARASDALKAAGAVDKWRSWWTTARACGAGISGSRRWNRLTKRWVI